MSIIIFGEMGSGKDTAAELIEKGLNGKIVKLGKRIREDVDTIYDIVPQQHNRRKLYQEYGQKMRKIFGDDVWNLILYHDIKDDIDKNNVHIISDARQPSEFTFWTNIGFFPIAIVADKEIRANRLIQRDRFDQSDNFNHETEANARLITHKIKDLESTGKALTITNNGTIDELKEQIAKLCNIVKNDLPVDSV